MQDQANTQAITDACRDCGGQIERVDVPLPATAAPVPWWYHTSMTEAHRCPGTGPVRPTLARIEELRTQRDEGNDYGEAEARELAALTGEPVRLPGAGSHDRPQS